MRIYPKVLLLVIIAAFILSGCAGRASIAVASAGDSASGQTGNTNPKASIVLDQKSAAEKTITPKGAKLLLKDSKGAGIEVYFPSGSVGSNTDLLASPLITAPVSEDQLLAAGFSITGKNSPSEHVKLQSDAVIMFTFGDDPGEDAAIVRFEDGGGYTVLPTQKEKAGSKTVLMTEVDGFSAYGVMKVTKQKIQEAADRLEKEGFDWVVEVDQKDSLKTSDGTDVTMMLRLKASNFKNWVPGTYAGTAYFTDLGVKQTETLPVAAAVVMVDSKVDFTLEPPSPELAPLVPEDPDAEPSLAPLLPSGDSDAEPSLAPLVPPGEDQDDYQGSGVFHFKIADLSIDVLPDDSSAGDITDTVDVPFTVTIRGPVATIEMKTPEGAVFFSGKSIGYSKESSAAKTPPKPITPADFSGCKMSGGSGN